MAAHEVHDAAAGTGSELVRVLDLAAVETDSFVAHLSDAVIALESIPQIRVVVLRGAPDRFLPAELGSDGGLRSSTMWDVRNGVLELVRLMERLWESPKVMIAEVYGDCTGAALLVATACDLTYVADDARIGAGSGVDRGVAESMLTWYIGVRRAKDLVFSERCISGAEAGQWGLANRAIQPDALRAAVNEMAWRIARLTPSLLHLKKAAVNRVFETRGYRESVRSGAEWAALAAHDLDDDHAPHGGAP